MIGAVFYGWILTIRNPVLPVLGEKPGERSGAGMLQFPRDFFKFPVDNPQTPSYRRRLLTRHPPLKNLGSVAQW